MENKIVDDKKKIMNGHRIEVGLRSVVGRQVQGYDWETMLNLYSLHETDNQAKMTEQDYFKGLTDVIQFMEVYDISVEVINR